MCTHVHQAVDARVRGAFEAMDADRSGDVSVSELGPALASLIPGYVLSSAAVRRTMARFQERPSSVIDLFEFTKVP